MPKAHRVFLNRVSGYADEASAFLRRRKITRQPFVRIYDANEVGHLFEPDSERGKPVFEAAGALIEAHHRIEDADEMAK